MGPAYAPIVPMRIRELKGEPIAALLARDTDPRDRRERSAGGGPSPWAVRREFRSTYRSERGPGERVTSGRWFGGGVGGSGKDPQRSGRDIG